MNKILRPSAFAPEKPVKAGSAAASDLLRSSIAYRALEARIAFDGAITATVIDVNETANSAPPVDDTAPGTAHTDGGATAIEPAAAAEAGMDDLISAALEPSAGGQSRTIVFIDSAVTDPEQISASIPDGAEVVFLDPNRDGVEQIAAVVEGRNDLDAIHIVSHGQQGQLFLGTAVLDAASMQGQHLDELTTIGQALSANGDILLYGCDFTGGDDGLEAAILLGSITGADIAASTDATGHADLGGDWDLETELGDIAATSISATEWMGLLAPPTIDLDTANLPANGGATENFQSNNLSGGTGWTGAWQVSSTGGATTGDAAVTTDLGDISLRLGDDGLQVNRTANLSAATTAILNLSYRRAA
ncbi:MAG: DUF4347 domain-containing protein, partial [Hyphomicrobium sp.]